MELLIVHSEEVMESLYMETFVKLPVTVVISYLVMIAGSALIMGAGVALK